MASIKKKTFQIYLCSAFHPILPTHLMKFNISLNSPLPTSLKGECKKATKILNSFIDPGQGLDIVIPPSILEKAQGLAIFTVLKAGFLFSGRAGSGLVVARLPDGSWSAPSAIVIGGMGAGGQIGMFGYLERMNFEASLTTSIGAELTDFVLVLNTKEAVKTFSHFGNVTLGGNISIAAGPIGRNAEASGSATFKHVSAVYSYNKTRGLFAGVSLEGSVIITRNDANEKLYGERVTAKELLNGSVPPPREADSLYRALNAKFHTLGNSNYQRTIEKESTLNQYKSTSISRPGTLRLPPINHSGKPPPPVYSHHQPAAPTSYQPQPHASNDTTIVSRAVPPPPPTRKAIRAKAIYDFVGQEKGDLSFNAGDIITVLESTDSQQDWWSGSVNGQNGSFPANYVELC
ncbi:hypothetical protein BD560DRAFT_492525 [Blakeslea trispora]|nr:hypothetical protein BD560DRAFT_492525 [Blakeslea trispora]